MGPASSVPFIAIFFVFIYPQPYIAYNHKAILFLFLIRKKNCQETIHFLLKLLNTVCNICSTVYHTLAVIDPLLI